MLWKAGSQQANWPPPWALSIWSHESVLSEYWIIRKTFFNAESKPLFQQTASIVHACKYQSIYALEYLNIKSAYRPATRNPEISQSKYSYRTLPRVQTAYDAWLEKPGFDTDFSKKPCTRKTIILTSNDNIVISNVPGHKKNRNEYMRTNSGLEWLRMSKTSRCMTRCEFRRTWASILACRKISWFAVFTLPAHWIDIGTPK